MPDVVITLPARIPWAKYEEELAEAEAGAQLNFRVPTLPKRARTGDRCYLVHKGHVRGYMTITGLQHINGFNCGTTGTPWPDGAYITRSGAFTYLREPIPHAGFQGYRYAPDNWRAQATSATAPKAQP